MTSSPDTLANLSIPELRASIAGRVIARRHRLRRGPPVRAAWVERFAAGPDQGDDAAYVNFLVDEGEARDPRGLSGRDVGAPGRDQGPLRPGQPVPPEPEHPAGGRLIHAGRYPSVRTTSAGQVARKAGGPAPATARRR
jgi:hypothetical protein